MNSLSDAVTPIPESNPPPSPLPPPPPPQSMTCIGTGLIHSRDYSKQHPGNAAPGSELVAFPPGTRLTEHIELLGEIGRGGMGIVYRALDHQSAKPRSIAVKVLQLRLRDQADALRRFLLEGESRKLKHDKLLEVYAIDRCPPHDIPFITMEYFAGWNLRQWLLGEAKSSRPFSLVDGLQILAEVCDPLAYVHRVWVHRDVKPENILARQLPSGRWDVKLADFGIAKPMEGIESIRLGAQIGTTDYMAPEQQANASTVNQQADIYSLGVIAYELLTGRRPQKSFLMPSTLCRNLTRTAAAVADEMIDRSLATILTERYLTAPDMQQGLIRLIQELDSTQVASASGIAWASLVTQSDSQSPARSAFNADKTTTANLPAPADPQFAAVEAIARRLAVAEQALAAQTPDWPVRVLKAAADFLAQAKADDWLRLREVAPHVPERELRDFASRSLAVRQLRHELQTARAKVTLRGSEKMK